MLGGVADLLATRCALGFCRAASRRGARRAPKRDGIGAAQLAEYQRDLEMRVLPVARRQVIRWVSPTVEARYRRPAELFEQHRRANF